MCKVLPYRIPPASPSEHLLQKNLIERVERVDELVGVERVR